MVGGEMMHPEFFYYNVDLLDHQRAFEDEADFITYIHLMKWKTMEAVRDDRRFQVD